MADPESEARTSESKSESKKGGRSMAEERDLGISEREARRGMEGIHSAAHDGVNLVRDVATDTVRAAGDVGLAAVDTTRHLLVGVADGVRDVLAHIVPFEWAGRETRGPGERKPH